MLLEAFASDPDALEPFDGDAFSRPVPAGMARAVWNFRVLPRGERRSVLSTATRVTCGDLESRRRWRRCWLFVRPFSGLIRDPDAARRPPRRRGERGGRSALIYVRRDD